MTQILLLDIAGNPTAWVPPTEAALYYANGKVSWDLGREEIILRGGINHEGRQSTLAIKPVIAISGSERMTSKLRAELPLGDHNYLLFRRDRHICAYCVQRFHPKELSRDHVLARSRGGEDTWRNCVTSCRKCNEEKGDKLVEQFRPLAYVPYAPCRWEHFLLQGRNILADQMEYLSANLPPHSRMLM